MGSLNFKSSSSTTCGVPPYSEYGVVHGPRTGYQLSSHLITVSMISPTLLHWQLYHSIRVGPPTHACGYVLTDDDRMEVNGIQGYASSALMPDRGAATSQTQGKYSCLSLQRSAGPQPNPVSKPLNVPELHRHLRKMPASAVHGDSTGQVTADPHETLSVMEALSEGDVTGCAEAEPSATAATLPAPQDCRALHTKAPVSPACRTIPYT